MDQENLDQAPEGNEQPQYTEVELKAMDMGWRPKSEFNGDEVDFIDAKEFVNRKPLFDKIETQSRELKNVKKALDALKVHYTTVRETEYKRALNELKEQRQEAISNADGVKFEQIDNQIKEIEQQAKEVSAVANVPNEPDIHPEFQAWVNQNPWYQSTPYMRTFADLEGARLHAQGLDRNEVLRKVAEAVKKEFPTKFRNPNKEDAPNVEQSGGSKTGGKSDAFELTAQERKIMNDLVRQGVLTKEKYITQLKEAKGLK